MSLINAEHLADAYEAVAKVNHYLVGIVARDDLDLDDYDAAEQILITRQNNESERSARHVRLNLALDCLEYDRKRLTTKHAGRFIASGA